MNKKSKITLFVLLSLLVVVFLESYYMLTYKSMSAKELQKKLAFVELVGLPDLALSGDASYIRHRSLSDVFSIYRDDATLREHEKLAFSIANPYIKNKNEK
jgi:hypothetical protein